MKYTFLGKIADYYSEIRKRQIFKFWIVSLASYLIPIESLSK